MNRDTLMAMALAASLTGCQTNYAYEPIVANPENLEMANAKCEMMSSSAEQGIVAWGSADYVAGAQLGNAIGNAIRADQFMKQCMTLQGWRRAPKSKPQSPAPPAKATPQSDDVENLVMVDAIASRCGISLSSYGRRAAAEAKRSGSPAVIKAAKARANRSIIGGIASLGQAAYCTKAKAIMAENGIL